MRMWMVDPDIMCLKHLCGEHLELHMFVGSIERNVSIQGYINNNLLEPSSIVERHEELVREMEKRGYNHKSPITIDWERFNKHFQMKRVKDHKIDREAALQELLSRCSVCRGRHNGL